MFERLFSNQVTSEVDKNQARRDVLKKSILDFIADDARRLHSRMGRNDQRKIDEYLTGVREIERRIELAESETEVDETYFRHQ